MAKTTTPKQQVRALIQLHTNQIVALKSNLAYNKSYMPESRQNALKREIELHRTFITELEQLLPAFL